MEQGQEKSNEMQASQLRQAGVMRRLFSRLRRLWCYKYTYWEECSSWTPGARWCGGGEFYEHEVTLLIPFWVRGYEAVADYYDRWCEEDWLYLDAA